VKLGDGDESEKDGGQAAETTLCRAPKEAEPLGIYAREGEADWAM
jgi:hypothetical protein